MTPETVSAEQPLRRARSQASTDRMAVGIALAPVKGLLGPLQVRAAMLIAQAAHWRDTRPLTPKIARLSDEVAQATAMLDRIVGSLPPEQRTHSQVVDLNRSLQQLRRSIPTR